MLRIDTGPCLKTRQRERERGKGVRDGLIRPVGMFWAVTTQPPCCSSME